MIRLRDDLAADTVLGVGAHADDLDFTAGGTIARLADEGAAVYYLILTDGSKGSADPASTPESVAARRRQEQTEAARRLGVRDVFFLDYEDGALEVTQALKRDIVRQIRRLQPDTVLAFDPTMTYYAPYGFINHPDHRACGQAVLDAVYPLARDRLAFPELEGEGLQPHKVRTLLLTNFERQDYFVDVSATFERKMDALAAHVSQVADLEAVRSRSATRAAALGERLDCRYAEGFVRVGPITAT